VETLPQREENGARPVGEARSQPAFQLHDLGAYQGLVAGGEHAIIGEVDGVDEATLAALDRVEGTPGFYRRVIIVLGDGASAETYLLIPSRSQVTRSSHVGAEGGDHRSPSGARPLTRYIERACRREDGVSGLSSFKAFVEEVRDRSDLVEVISRDIELRRVGGVLKGLSPFHPGALERIGVARSQHAKQSHLFAGGCKRLLVLP